MFFADYHTHSNFSSDSTTPMEQNIQRAIELGLQEIAVTDHIDFDYPDLNFPFMFNYDEYRKHVDFLKEKYGHCIKIILGVEIGIQPHVYSLINNLVHSNHYDFIIGSTHCIDKFDLCTNQFFEGKTKHDSYVGYFKEVLYNIENCPIFNVYGHVDFINRYGNFADKTMNYEEFAFITDEILKALIKKEKGIEINTSGFRYGLGHTHPQLPLVKRYRQLGGEIITVGSDAHIPGDITRDFHIAYQMLKSAGFKYITTFENQKPSFVKING